MESNPEILVASQYPGKCGVEKSDIDWPPRSPDLTPPDFFLWGFLKSKVYANKPKIIEKLIDNIRAEMAAILPEIRSAIQASRFALDLIFFAYI